MYIKDNVQASVIINKSRFIAYAFKVNTLEDITNYIKETARDHAHATHICYAYKLDNHIKLHDAGEPSGTAGYPIYNVIEKNKLNHILIIVVRYFGGIKLGAGPLTRAYGKSARDVLKMTIISKPPVILKLTFAYDRINQVEHLLKKDRIINKSIKDETIYEVEVQNTELIKENHHLFIDIKKLN